MVIPECPSPLLGRDLLTKIGAYIYFDSGETQVTNREGRPIHVLTLHLEDEYRLHPRSTPLSGVEMSEWLQKHPTVWAETGGMGFAAHHTPIWVELKPGASPARVKQYPMSLEAQKGITPHIQCLRKQGILIPCHSAWNTPLITCKKAQLQ
jgi:hypothetical protein